MAHEPRAGKGNRACSRAPPLATRAARGKVAGDDRPQRLAATHDRRDRHAARTGWHRHRARFGRGSGFRGWRHRGKTPGTAGRDASDVSRCNRCAARQRTRAVVSRAALVHRRNGARAARSRRASRHAVAAGALHRARRAPRGAGRIHAPRISERQARPRAGGKRCRPDRRRDGNGGARRREELDG